MEGAYKEVQEIHASLLRDCEITVQRELHLDEPSLRHVIQCFVDCHLPSNLCLYSSDPYVGYFVPGIQQYCRPHPSSALAYLGRSASVAVFESILETSNKYLLSITPVELEDVEQAWREWIVKQQEIQAVQAYPICQAGQAVIDKIYHQRHNIRQALRDAFGSLILVPSISWSNETPRKIALSIRCSDSQSVLDWVNEVYVTPILTQLLQETKEAPVTESSDVTLCIGAGANLISCQMPGEFKKVKILMEKAYYASELDTTAVRNLLQQFGELTLQPKETKTNFWGYAMFEDPVNAEAAVDHHFEKISCKPAVGGVRNQKGDIDGSHGTVTCEFLRKASKGHAFVVFPPDLDTMDELTNSTFYIGPHLCRVRRNKKNPNDLYITGIPRDCTPQMITENGPEILQHSTKIIIPSDPCPRSEEADKTELKRVVEEPLRAAGLVFPPMHLPKYAVRFARGFFNIPSTSTAIQLYKVLNNETLVIHGEKVQARLDLQHHLTLSSSLYQWLKSDVDAVARAIGGDVKFKYKPGVKLGTLVMAASEVDVFFCLKEQIIALSKGTKIMCGNTTMHHLLAPHQGDALSDVMKESGALIEKDHRLKEILIFGNAAAQQRARELINGIIESMAAADELQTEITLRSPNKPRQLLRIILRDYDNTMERIRAVAGCNCANLNLSKGTLVFVGSRSAYNEVSQILEEIAAGCKDLDHEAANCSSDDCPICICSVEDRCRRLSLCGHSYCQDCLDGYVKHLVDDKKFPMVCASEGCDQVLYIGDITITDKLCRNIVSDLVAKNLQTFKYCRTPDCLNFYRTTKTARAFHCSLCHASTCTSCHGNAHADDIPCESAMDPDSALLRWMAADPGNRKRCPKCRQGIEKNGGCLHMTCTSCQAHICWKCERVFPDSDSTYHHMGTCAA